MVSLQPIDDSNRGLVEALSVSSIQEQFVAGVAYIAQYLWRLLIDQRYQGRGYGAAALDLIVEYFRGRPGVGVMWTSCGEGDGSPLGFYERYGFEQTGERVFDNEILLRLKIA